MGNTASNNRSTSYYNPHTTQRQAQCRQEFDDIVCPSVSEFTKSPERYPKFVLVMVLSTGKMQVMTRAEACANRKVKIVSNSREAPADASFFAQSPPDASSFQSQGSQAAYMEGIQMEDVLALDLLTGLFVVVSRFDILREPWRYRVFCSM